ncbi:aspartate/glutamate racemase family protein, partial [Litorisediminicola beolgyonensis]
ASGLGARFAVATTTPELQDRIDALMRGAGGDYVGSFFAASSDPVALTRDRAALDAGLLGAVREAAAAGAERVIIGGGPLAEAGLRLADRSPVPLVHPLIAAAQEMVAALEAAT